MASYANWFLSYTHATAEACFRCFQQTSCAPHFLYYQPRGLALYVVQEDTPAPDGAQLVTGERIPSNCTLFALTLWIREHTSRIDLLPGD